ncbi:MAG TPA: nuclear transport factor 2 family protein [Polyangiaceae bacterium]
MTSDDNVRRARAYLAAIERFAPAEELEAFLDPGVVQEEFPNRLLANGATRDLAALREAGARGKALLSAQRFDVRNAVAAGDTVALEIAWSGTLAVPFQTVSVGGELRARFAFFIEFSAGRIVKMRNYDCFEPW